MGGAMPGQQALRTDRRRERIPLENVKAKMLDTALQHVLASGIGITLEEFSLEDMIQQARVPRSSVYRLWPYKDLFVDDLLCHAAGPDGLFGAHEVFDQATIDIVHETIDQHRHRFGSLEGRRAVLCEVVRLGAGRNFQALASQRMRIRTVLMAAVGSSHNIHARGELATALERAGEQSRSNITRLIEHVMTSLGLRLRNPAWTVEHLQSAGSALLQGLAMRRDVAQAATEHTTSQPAAPTLDVTMTQPLPGPALDGHTTDWTLPALAYLALVDSFLEPDPDFQPPATAPTQQ